MGIGDILSKVGGVASLIPGIGTIGGAVLSGLGGVLGASESKTAEEEAKKAADLKAQQEAAMKAKQAGEASATSTDTQIASPNMAILAQQLQMGGQQPNVNLMGGMSGVSGLLNNRRNGGY